MWRRTDSAQACCSGLAKTSSSVTVLQIAGAVRVDELSVDVRDRQIVEMTDHDGLRVEVLVGHLHDLAFAITF